MMRKRFAGSVFRRIAALTLAFMMLASMLPVDVFASPGVENGDGTDAEVELAEAWEHDGKAWVSVLSLDDPEGSSDDQESPSAGAVEVGEGVLSISADGKTIMDPDGNSFAVSDFVDLAPYTNVWTMRSPSNATSSTDMMGQAGKLTNLTTWDVLKDFRMDVEFSINMLAGGPAKHLYTWKMSDTAVRRDEAVGKDLVLTGTSTVVGKWLVDTHGQIYIVLNANADAHSVLEVKFDFTGRWDVSDATTETTLAFKKDADVVVKLKHPTYAVVKKVMGTNEGFQYRSKLTAGDDSIVRTVHDTFNLSYESVASGAVGTYDLVLGYLQTLDKYKNIPKDEITIDMRDLFTVENVWYRVTKVEDDDTDVIKVADDSVAAAPNAKTCVSVPDVNVTITSGTGQENCDAGSLLVEHIDNIRCFVPGCKWTESSVHGSTAVVQEMSDSWHSHVPGLACCISGCGWDGSAGYDDGVADHEHSYTFENKYGDGSASRTVIGHVAMCVNDGECSHSRIDVYHVEGYACKVAGCNYKGGHTYVYDDITGGNDLGIVTGHVVRCVNQCGECGMREGKTVPHVEGHKCNVTGCTWSATSYLPNEIHDHLYSFENVVTDGAVTGHTGTCKARDGVLKFDIDLGTDVKVGVNQRLWVYYTLRADPGLLDYYYMKDEAKWKELDRARSDALTAVANAGDYAAIVTAVDGYKSVVDGKVSGDDNSGVSPVIPGDDLVKAKAAAKVIVNGYKSSGILMFATTKYLKSDNRIRFDWTNSIGKKGSMAGSISSGTVTVPSFLTKSFGDGQTNTKIKTYLKRPNGSYVTGLDGQKIEARQFKIHLYNTGFMTDHVEVRDTLVLKDVLESIDYIQEEAYLKCTTTGHEGHSIPLKFVTCPSKETFENLTYGQTTATYERDGIEFEMGQVFLYGNEFKFFMPSRNDDAWLGCTDFDLMYYTTWSDEATRVFILGNSDLSLINTAQFQYKDLYIPPPGYIPPPQPPMLSKQVVSTTVNEKDETITNWKLDLSVPENQTYTRFLLTDYLPRDKDSKSNKPIQDYMMGGHVNDDGAEYDNYAYLWAGNTYVQDSTSSSASYRYRYTLKASSYTTEMFEDEYGISISVTDDVTGKDITDEFRVGYYYIGTSSGDTLTSPDELKDPTSTESDRYYSEKVDKVEGYGAYYKLALFDVKDGETKAPNGWSYSSGFVRARENPYTVTVRMSTVTSRTFQKHQNEAKWQWHPSFYARANAYFDWQDPTSGTNTLGMHTGVINRDVDPDTGDAVITYETWIDMSKRKYDPPRSIYAYVANGGIVLTDSIEAYLVDDLNCEIGDKSEPTWAHPEDSGQNVFGTDVTLISTSNPTSGGYSSGTTSLKLRFNWPTADADDDESVLEKLASVFGLRDNGSDAGVATLADNGALNGTSNSSTIGDLGSDTGYRTDPAAPPTPVQGEDVTTTMQDYKSILLRYTVRIPYDKLNQRNSLSQTVTIYQLENADSYSLPLMTRTASDAAYSDFLTKTYVTDSTKKTTGSYTITADVEDYLRTSGVDTLNIIDESKGAMTIIADTIVVQGSSDGKTYEILPENEYELMFEDDLGLGDTDARLIISVSLAEHRYGHYKVTYHVDVSGPAGTTVDVVNRAYVTGLKGMTPSVPQKIKIDEVNGSAQGVDPKITVLKYNTDNYKDRLAGASFVIYELSSDAAKTLSNAKPDDGDLRAIADSLGSECWIKLMEGTTDKSGTVTFGNDSSKRLKINTLYKITEIRQPDGYVLPVDPNTYFYAAYSNNSTVVPAWLKSFNARNVVDTVQIGNRKAVVRILKLDEETRAALSGAQFTLFPDRECKGTGTSAIELDGGIHLFGNLDLDTTYWMTETRAPDDHVASGHVYEVKVGADGSVTVDGTVVELDDTFVVLNAKYSPFELPGTGGAGTAPWLVSGGCMAMFAVVMFLARRKRTGA